ncbi:MIR domain protein [Ichthyophthirius multifiliis]|uniref:MIR domain protein n=1 Tax=Ichthyophthirius multifiliis TaxID=5932 RepID=G0QNY8_ICHMU|nr:MIR domain protein [Ichthyophthirius multifiliis]EGR33075.1 MIR domain protein [Ichthyophthirius multifiliis]|eukprot:XP_004037061.1 MIR domain protein [Ichthyophthirius multifiliis]
MPGNIDSNKLLYGHIIVLQLTDQKQYSFHIEGFFRPQASLQKAQFQNQENFLFKIMPSFQTSYIDQLNKLNLTAQSNVILQKKVLDEYKQNIDIYNKLKGQPILFYTPIQLLHVSTNKYLQCNYSQADYSKDSFKLDLSIFSSKYTIFQMLPVYNHQKNMNRFFLKKKQQKKNIYMNFLQQKSNIYINDSKRNQFQILIICIYFILFSIENNIKQKLGQQISKSNQSQINTKELQKYIPNPLPGIYQNFQNMDQLQTISQIQQKKKMKTDVTLFFNQKSMWTIKYYSYKTDNNITQQYGDKVWIHHVENKNNLIIQYNGEQSSILFEYNNNQNILKYNRNTNGIWVIENTILFEGGTLDYNQCVYFKHFALKKYLQLQYNNYQYYLDLLNEPNENCLFQLIKLPSLQQNNQNQLEKDSLFYIKSFKHKVYINNSFKNNQNLNQNQGIQISFFQSDDSAFQFLKATHSEILGTNFIVQNIPIIQKCIYYMKKNNTEKQIIKDSIILNGLLSLNQSLISVNEFCINKIILTNNDDSRNFNKPNKNRQIIIQEQNYLYYLLEMIQLIVNVDELKELQFDFYKELYQNQQRQFSDKVMLTINKILHVLKTKKGIDIQKKQEQPQDIFTEIYNQQNFLKIQQNTLYLQHRIQILQNIYQLLISLCKDNQVNQNIVYQKLKFVHYHAIYLKDASDCLIQILTQNESLLNNLSDNIKLQVQRQSQSVSYSENTVEIQSLNLINNSIIQSNLLLFFKRQTEEMHNYRKQIKLNIVKDICKFNDKGVSVNQEQIYKFCFENGEKTKFHKAIFYKFQIVNNNLKIILNKDNVLYIENMNSHKLQKEKYNYFLQQINFYSDLAQNRNFLWKNYLEKLFPIQFLFDKIFDSSLQRELRSSFCNLALSVYIDQEPLDYVLVPQMCKIQYFIQKALIYIQKEINSFEQSFQLNQNVLQSRNQKCKVFYFNKKIYFYFIYIYIANQSINKLVSLENVLLLNISKILIILIQFNILEIINKKQLYSSIFTKYMKILNYDSAFPQYSYFLNKQNCQKYLDIILNKNNKKYKIAQAFSQLYNKVSKQILMASQALGIQNNSRSSQNELEDETQDIDTKNMDYDENILLDGFVTLQCVFKKEKEENNQIQIQIKKKYVIYLFLFKIQEWIIQLIISQNGIIQKVIFFLLLKKKIRKQLLNLFYFQKQKVKNYQMNSNKITFKIQKNQLQKFYLNFIEQKKNIYQSKYITKDRNRRNR